MLVSPCIWIDGKSWAADPPPPVGARVCDSCRSKCRGVASRPTRAPPEFSSLHQRLQSGAVAADRLAGIAEALSLAIHDRVGDLLDARCSLDDRAGAARLINLATSLMIEQPVRARSSFSVEFTLLDSVGPCSTEFTVTPVPAICLRNPPWWLLPRDVTSIRKPSLNPVRFRAPMSGTADLPVSATMRQAPGADIGTGP